MKVDLNEKIKIPEGVKASLDKGMLTVEGKRGVLKRRFADQKVDVVIDGDSIVISTRKGTKRQKRMVFTFKSHIINLIEGVINGYVYKLKICSSHFPVSVSIEGNKFLIKNFLGEKVPRKAKILEGVSVKVEEDTITVEGSDLEKVGQTAASIEHATRISKRTRWKFQDGIYITTKAGKDLK